MNTNVVAYGRFPVAIEQEQVDLITHQIDLFMDLLGLTQVDSFYELVKPMESPVLYENAIDACKEHDCALLTFSFVTLHPDESRAYHLVKQLQSDGIEVYFVHAESTIKMLLR